MKALLLALLLPFAARAHIGSPNVFFEGKAGPHPVRVVIRPPATLPGIAQVDVRVLDDEPARVTLRAIFAAAGEDSAPAPLDAMPVAGDPHLFNAPLYLLRRGTFNIQITVTSLHGSGLVNVPLNSAATQRPVMPPALGAILASLGILLFLSAATLAGAAARDASLAPDAMPTPRDITRGHRTAILTALVLGGALYAGTLRWQAMDREFRSNALAQPIPIAATLRTEGDIRLLHLAPLAGASAAWDTLAADHGKLMHLFLLRAQDFAAFAHLHPVRRDRQTFEAVLPVLPPGAYQLYAELTYEDGRSETLTATLALPAPLGAASQPAADMAGEVWCLSPPAPVGDSAAPFALDPDDSWHVSPAAAGARTSPLMGGSRMVFQTPGPILTNRETSLRFAVLAPGGEGALLQGYMGMLGHAVIRRGDGSVFTHLHPAGSISMAAQTLLAPPARPATPMLVNPTGTNEVAFPYAFPRPGDYRLWVQVRIASRVVTGVFEVRVQPESGCAARTPRGGLLVQ